MKEIILSEETSQKLSILLDNLLTNAINYNFDFKDINQIAKIKSEIDLQLNQTEQNQEIEIKANIRKCDFDLLDAYGFDFKKNIKAYIYEVAKEMYENIEKEKKGQA